jgi:hypothetical protein
MIPSTFFLTMNFDEKETCPELEIVALLLKVAHDIGRYGRVRTLRTIFGESGNIAGNYGLFTADKPAVADFSTDLEPYRKALL